MRISRRLEAVAAMVSPCKKVADVGTDHGYIPIYLVENSIVTEAIAMDINAGPLDVAKRNIITHQVLESIETRLSDGVESLLANEVEAVVISGMGGNLIIKILSEGAQVLKTVQELVLQPQSEIAEVRKFLQGNGYSITAENMICEDGKFYPIIKVIHGEMKLTRQIDVSYGPCLLRDRNPVLKQFLEKERDTLLEIEERLLLIGGTKAGQREEEIKQEMCRNEEARKEYE